MKNPRNEYARTFLTSIDERANTVVSIHISPDSNAGNTSSNGHRVPSPNHIVPANVAAQNEKK